VSVVDDLAGWRIGLLADAGRKKLTSLVLGSEQERALPSLAPAIPDEIYPGSRPITSRPGAQTHLDGGLQFLCA
jgi:hypothetical protein